MTDIIGWAGTAVFFVAAILVAHKNIAGMWLMMVGNLIFAYVGYASGISSLIAVSIMASVLDYYGVRKWSKL